jgi:hypothetical protein
MRYDAYAALLAAPVNLGNMSTKCAGIMISCCAHEGGKDGNGGGGMLDRLPLKVQKRDLKEDLCGGNHEVMIMSLW